MNKHLRNTPKSTFSKLSIAGYSRHYSLQPGDRLIEPIFQTGFTKHHSIYLGVDIRGIEWIAENHKFHGIRLVKATKYFITDKNFRIDPFVGNYYEREAAVKRALNLLGKHYDLVSYKCEHYASYVQTGKTGSEQVDNVLEGIKTLAIATLLVGYFNLITND